MAQRRNPSDAGKQARNSNRRPLLASAAPATRHARGKEVGAPETPRITRSSTRFCCGVGIAAVAVGLASFPQTEAFLSAGPCLLSRATRGFTRKTGDCVGRVRGVRMSSEGQREEGAKPQFIRSPDMDKETKTIIPPPDREAALKMVAAREAKQVSKGELGSYHSADIASMPEPPYYFQVPGEFGNDTLCTDPKWHVALLSLKWLGLPCEVRHDDEEEEPTLEMGPEVYDDAAQLTASLPERNLLSDFVESSVQNNAALSKLEPAWTRLYYNNDAKAVGKLEKALDDALTKVENILNTVSANGDLLEGDDLTIGDIDLAVTTFHMMAAFDLEKQWRMPSKFKSLNNYMATMHDMEMFKIVVPPKDVLAQRYKLR